MKKAEKIFYVFLIGFLLEFFFLSFAAGVIDNLPKVWRILIDMNLGALLFGLFKRIFKVIYLEGEENEGNKKEKGARTLN
jgi:hypothetical protein